MEIEKKCPQCHKEFVCQHYRNRTYCSEECKKSKADSKKRKITCLMCQKTLETAQRKTYCSNKCRKEHAKFIYKEKNSGLNVCSATIGAIGELRVCVDLLIKGFNVYRSVSPACSADLVITKEGRLYRIEVTTGYFDAKGNIINNKKYADQSKFDVVAIAFKNGEIKYVPNLEELQ